MTGSATLTFIATVLAVEAGIVDIDLGSKSGLRTGDQGTVFYEVGTGAGVSSVEVGSATVFETSMFAAKLRTEADLEVRPGFLVSFELPNSRIAGDVDSPQPESTAARETAVVSTNEGSCLNLRQLPAVAAPASECLPNGTEVTVIETVPDWKNARLQDGREGWLASQFLSGGDAPSHGAAALPETAEALTDPGFEPGFPVSFELPNSRIAGDVDSPQPESTAARETAVVSTNEGSCLNLRQLPAVAAPASECLPNGTEVTVIETVPDWKNARLQDGREGWLASQFLSGGDPSSDGAAARPETAEAPTDPGFEVESGPEALASKVETTGPTETSTQLREADDTVERLLDEIDSTQSELSDAERSRSELTHRLLENAVLGFESSLAAVRAELERARADRVDLEGRVDTMEEDRRRLDRELEASVLSARELRAELDQRDLELASTRSDLNEVRLRGERLEGDLAAARSELERANSERDRLLAELAAAEYGRKSDLKRELKEATMALQNAEREKEGLEIWLDERGRDLADAEARVAIMQSEIDRLESMSPIDARESAATQAALSQERRRTAELEGRLVDLERDSRDLEVELAATRRELAELRRSREASPPASEDYPTALPDTETALVVLASAEPCLNFRAEPDIKSETFDCLEPGIELGPLGHWEGWQYVELGDGRAGWVSSEHVGPVGTGGSGL